MRFTSFLYVIGGAIAPLFANADVTLPNPLGITSFPGLLCLFARIVFWFAFPLALLALLLAAFFFLTSGGNERKLSQAKEIMTWAIIGWAVVLISQAIALVIVSIIGGEPASFTSC